MTRARGGSVGRLSPARSFGQRATFHQPSSPRASFCPCQGLRACAPSLIPSFAGIFGPVAAPFIAECVGTLPAAILRNCDPATPSAAVAGVARWRDGHGQRCFFDDGFEHTIIVNGAFEIRGEWRDGARAGIHARRLRAVFAVSIPRGMAARGCEMESGGGVLLSLPAITGLLVSLGLPLEPPQ